MATTIPPGWLLSVPSVPTRMETPFPPSPQNSLAQFPSPPQNSLHQSPPSQNSISLSPAGVFFPAHIHHCLPAFPIPAGTAPTSFLRSPGQPFRVPSISAAMAFPCLCRDIPMPPPCLSRSRGTKLWTFPAPAGSQVDHLLLLHFCAPRCPWRRGETVPVLLSAGWQRQAAPSAGTLLQPARVSRPPGNIVFPVPRPRQRRNA